VLVELDAETGPLLPWRPACLMTSDRRGRAGKNGIAEVAGSIPACSTLKNESLIVSRWLPLSGLAGLTSHTPDATVGRGCDMTKKNPQSAAARRPQVAELLAAARRWRVGS